MHIEKCRAEESEDVKSLGMKQKKDVKLDERYLQFYIFQYILCWRLTGP